MRVPRRMKFVNYSACVACVDLVACERDFASKESCAEKRKAPTSRGFSSTAGGASRSRTGLNGFAGRCITALLSRRKRTAEPSQLVAYTTGSQICSMAGRSTKQKGKLCFPECLERETSLELATSTLARLRSTN